MSYAKSTLIARQHGWGDDTAAPPAGQSVGAAIGGLLTTLFGNKNQQTPVVTPAAPDHTMTYLALAGAAGIGLYLWKRKKR